ncbi:MAG: hypothetical protein GYA23_12065 [Methanomicrobiales archaeon]|nr:hypothetical protein [Methanomicrobiales archaeon]
MFESIGRSIALARTSWDILMQDKKLLAFPILSGILSILVLLTFILPLIATGSFMGHVPGGQFAYYAILFAFYLVSYFVVIFFNTALISCVNARLQGRDMSVTEGLSASVKHLPSIFAWALVSATVGLILHLLHERSGWIGQIIVSLLGGAWGLITFFVVPILVLEDKGVVDSVKESVSLIRKTWGESIIGSGGIAIIFVLIGVVAFLGVLATMLLGNVVIFGLALAAFLILVVILAVVAAAMQGIFITALYTYARTGNVPKAFDRELIANAFVPKPGSPGTI